MKKQMLQIILKEYLARLELEEQRRPKEYRKNVPTMADISRESGISFATINRIANGHARHLNLDTGNRIIKAVRKRGFNMEAQDLIRFAPDE